MALQRGREALQRFRKRLATLGGRRSQESSTSALPTGYGVPREQQRVLVAGTTDALYRRPDGGELPSVRLLDLRRELGEQPEQGNHFGADTGLRRAPELKLTAYSGSSMQGPRTPNAPKEPNAFVRLGRVADGLVQVVGDLAHLVAEPVIYLATIGMYLGLNGVTLGKFRHGKLSFQGLRKAAVTGLKAIPIAGSIGELIEASSAHHLGTFEQMSGADRLWALGIGIVGLIPIPGLIPVLEAVEGGLRAGRSVHGAVNKGLKLRGPRQN